ncbi:MAG: hypothetical protein PHE18_00450 [Candidatus Omnitrophica bacterium]|nr:hypothetical protein [Candidatus Omnitrophota bacterium]MDD5552334.1 hypothetical protein [Candidatus Omnitrophota bacterium]
MMFKARSLKLREVLIICFLISNLTGCATIIESCKGLAGVSTRSVEDARKNAIKKAYNYDYSSCVSQVRDILKGIRSYIYADNGRKQMIAVYLSEEDTTPVGIFFKEIDPKSTQVEVSSPSTYAKEFISGKISDVLEKKITLEELEAEINAKRKEDDSETD